MVEKCDMLFSQGYCSLDGQECREDQTHCVYRKKHEEYLVRLRKKARFNRIMDVLYLLMLIFTFLLVMGWMRFNQI